MDCQSQALHPDDIAQAVGKAESLSKHRKYEFLKNSWTPPTNYKFPARVSGKQNRYFQFKWLRAFEWLAYSEAEGGGGLCKLCVLFPPKSDENNVIEVSMFLSALLLWEVFSNFIEDSLCMFAATFKLRQQALAAVLQSNGGAASPCDN